MRKQPLTEKLKRRRYRTRILGGKTSLDREYARKMQEAESAARPAGQCRQCCGLGVLISKGDPMVPDGYTRICPACSGPETARFLAKLREAESAAENQVVDTGEATGPGAMRHLKLRPSTDIWTCRHGIGHPDHCPDCAESALPDQKNQKS